MRRQALQLTYTGSVLSHTLFTEVRYHNKESTHSCSTMPIPAAVHSKVRVYGRSFAGIEGSNSAGDTNVSLLRVWCAVL
jgi:hypothetical protein